MLYSFGYSVICAQCQAVAFDLRFSLSTTHDPMFESSSSSSSDGDERGSSQAQDLPLQDASVLSSNDNSSISHSNISDDDA